MQLCLGMEMNVNTNVCFLLQEFGLKNGFEMFLNIFNK